VEELVEEGVGFVVPAGIDDDLLEELDYALRPPVHERFVPSYGAIIHPTVPPEDWYISTQLTVSRRRTSGYDDPQVRRFADGFSSWAVRGPSGLDEFVVFDRSAGSERDLVVLASAAGARLVQRDLNGNVRVVGADAAEACGSFDRVLLDPPCSGLGTLARHPDLRWRMTPERIAGLLVEQERLLDTALRCVAPGGRLVYSVCTLTEEENAAVVGRARLDGLELLDEQTLVPDAEHDGMYVARWVRP